MSNEIKVLTRDNFESYWRQATGLVHFKNPFDFEGEKREKIKKIALDKIIRRYSGGGVFGYYNNPEDFKFVEDGTFSDMVRCLTNFDDTHFVSVDDYTLFELEDDDLICYLQLENGDYLSF